MRARHNLSFNLSLGRNATSLVFAGLVIGLATSSCGFLPKKVTKEDCEKWGDHFATLTKEASAKEIKKCAGKVSDEGGDSKAGEKAGNKAANGEIDKLKEEIVKGCTSQEGKSYITKDADCYLKAKELKDWKTCDFKTPFFTDFSTLAETFEKTFQSKCDEGIEKAKGSGGDKPKGDKPKKKSKGDDD